jgi:hypothetical protein
MRKLLACLLALVLLIGCDNSFDEMPQGLSANKDERRVTFRFELASRALKQQPARSKIPFQATDIRFVGRDADLNILFDVTEAKDDEFVLRTAREVTSMQIDVLSGQVVVLSNLFEIPDKNEVTFLNPPLEPRAYTGGTALTIDPPGVQLGLEQTVEFQSFLSSGNERLAVSEFTRFSSAGPETLAFSPEKPQTARAVQAGTTTVAGQFGLPRAEMVVGVATGSAQVRLLDVTNTQPGALEAFLAFAAPFQNGISVAVGHFNSDDVADLVVGTRSGTTRVRVVDGATFKVLRDIRPFEPEFQGGVRVACGDVSGDGAADVIVGAGPGGAPTVKVFDGRSGNLIEELQVFDPSFIGGVNVASADFNQDGRDDLVVGAGTGGPSTVRVFDGASGNLVKEFFAFEQQYVGGVRVAAGDVTGDGHADIVASVGPSSLPEVKVFDGRSTNPIGSFFAYPAGMTSGIFLSTTDLDGDGVAEIITGTGPETPATIKVFSGVDGEVRAEYAPLGGDFKGGVCVAGIAHNSRREVLRAQSQVTVGSGAGPEITPVP